MSRMKDKNIPGGLAPSLHHTLGSCPITNTKLVLLRNCLEMIKKKKQKQKQKQTKPNQTKPKIPKSNELNKNYKNQTKQDPNLRFSSTL